MGKDLAYDMTLEVRGLIRSLGVRMRLDRELAVGETFHLKGRRWVVAAVRPVQKEDLDRRLIPREVDEENFSPIAV